MRTTPSSGCARSSDGTHLLLAEACAAAAAGDWEHAAASFERALDARPLDCCTHAWLGISYVEQGRIEDARRKLVDAEVRTPVKCTTAGELSRRLEGRAA